MLVEDAGVLGLHWFVQVVGEEAEVLVDLEVSEVWVEPTILGQLVLLLLVVVRLVDGVVVTIVRIVEVEVVLVVGLESQVGGLVVEFDLVGLELVVEDLVQVRFLHLFQG